MPRPKPLLALEDLPLRSTTSFPPRADNSSPSSDDDGVGVGAARKKHWSAYIPTFVALGLILMPHFPLIHVLLFYYNHRKSLTLFLVHLVVTYGLTAVALTSFMVVLVRDPGPVDGVKAQVIEDERVGGRDRAAQAVEGEDEGAEEESGEMSLKDMLMAGSVDGKGHDDRGEWDGNGERRWCQKCWSPKPERCHHCRECGRCVLKMDHHCPWLGAKCIGHRTYASFVHLLFAITLLCIYCFAISIPPIQVYLSWEYTAIKDGDWTPYYVIFLALMSFVFGLTIGSFWGYHVYLISTNQTTLEHLAPFLLLRHIPAVPPPTSSSSSSSASSSPQDRDPESPYFFPSPPAHRTSFAPLDIAATASGASTPRLQEHLLSTAQRRTVRAAAGRIKMYDLGWRRNWDEVVGGGAKRRGWKWWVRMLLCGGVGKGDGYAFEYNSKARRQLDRLAARLAKQSS